MYKDRVDAGKILAKQLEKYSNQNPLVLGLPRGGVVVASEVAKTLHAPMDVVIVRKIGAPHNSELAIGAIAEDHIIMLDNRTIETLGIAEGDLKESIDKEEKELERRLGLYRESRPLPTMDDRLVILVDDGLATGFTGLAAIKVVKKQRPKKLFFALPICAYESRALVEAYVDSLICLLTPPRLSSIGAYYENFSQVSDEEVVNLLRESRARYQKSK